MIRKLSLAAALATYTAFSAVQVVRQAPPTIAETAPTPGVGFFHVDLVDDPCPSTTPSCTDHRNQKVPLSFWYPITNTRGLTVGTFALSDGSTSYGSINLPDVSHAGTDRIAGNHPLIVFSHGSGGAGIQNHSLMVDLAKAGNIIVAPTHRGHSLVDTGLGIPQDSFATTAIKRYLDFRFALSVADRLFRDEITRTESRDPVVVAMGHSMGAMTALTMPTGLNPFLQPDDRIDAVVAINPQPVIMNAATPLYGPGGLIVPNILTTLHKPVLTVAALNDGIAWNALMDDVGRSITAAPIEERIDIGDADHTATTDVWRLKALIDQTNVPQPVKTSLQATAEVACPDHTGSCVDRFHDLQSEAIIGFLDRAL